MIGLCLASLFVLQVFATQYNYTVMPANSGNISAPNLVWLFTDGGASGLGFNPTLYANVGDQLFFNVSGLSAASQTFSIHTSNATAGSSTDRYTGASPVALSSDGILVLTIGSDSPSVLYYVSENSATAQGMIMVSFNCSGLPLIGNSAAGNCVAGAENGAACIPVCSSGFNGSLTAVCMNGVWNWTGSCVATNSPTPTNPTPVPTGVVTNPTPSSSNNNIVTYTFDIDGTSSNNCSYVNNTVVVNLNSWGQSDVATNGASFNANLIDCTNNNINSGSSWTIEVVISGVNADSVVIDEDSFRSTLENQLETDNNVTVIDVTVDRNSGFFKQASILSFLVVVLVAIMA